MQHRMTTNWPPDPTRDAPPPVLARYTNTYFSFPLTCIGAFLIGVTISVYVSNLSDDRGRYSLLFGICVVTGGISAWMHLLGKRLMVAEVIRLFDIRRGFPVIYLRPFVSAGVSASRGNTLSRIWRAFATGPEENLLNRLWQFGHVATIARPGDHFPYPGAIHLQVPSEEWREHVSDYIARTRIVVIRLSDSVNLMWEAARAAETQSKSALLFWFPPQDTWGEWLEFSDWADIQNALQTHFGIDFPEKVSRGSYLWFAKDDSVMVSRNIGRFMSQHSEQLKNMSIMVILRWIQLAMTLLWIALGWRQGHVWYQSFRG